MIIDDDKDETNDEAQSDIVAIALNLAYLTREEIADMKFDKTSLTEISNKHANGKINWKYLFKISFQNGTISYIILNHLEK